MITFDSVCVTIGLEPGELELWIRERWVRAEGVSGGWIFHEVDVARLYLIKEMRRDLAIDEEAMPVVLSLLDQVYALRRELRRVGTAIGSLPEETRQLLLTQLGGRDDPGDG